MLNDSPTPGYRCRILADSVTAADQRLTTFEVTFPRIVLAEFNTHRVLSRNSASSRAIPIEKRIQQVVDHPFVPVFAANQRGMQPGDVMADQEQRINAVYWLQGRDRAVEIARRLAEGGVHKQWANRVIEPWMWQTVICSATEWDNFLNLRTHSNAQAEIRTIAEMMRDARAASNPVFVRPGGWHLPLVRHIDEPGGATETPGLEKAWWLHHDVLAFVPHAVPISAGRCARVSYLTHDGKRDLGADVGLCTKLTTDHHMSPLEHPAIALDTDDRVGNFTGWVQLRKFMPNEAIYLPEADPHSTEAA